MADQRISHLRSGGAGSRGNAPGVGIRRGRDGQAVYSLTTGPTTTGVDPTSALLAELHAQRRLRGQR